MNVEREKNILKKLIVESIQDELEKVIDDIVDDYHCEIEHWKEKYEDLEKQIEDNYVPRKMSDYTGDRYDDRF